ncbi:MAG TPA: YdcF family protein [Leptolyngbyaceae cyanobacterium M33_DOE_097]|uniref:YdcF family protein n=1 Tax=Oscillatoriales cyanobacterium SpSt-418 TaxID=2282169 RepID=A0A7C3KHY4_9CYAN|nr:YdcF family protein [Leptolyngbyaceae cyanobacterium M33_DOE_097]
MFLFLSKLLPLFFYPLGLACLLLLVALVMLWRKRPRRAAIPVALALAVLLIGSNGWLAGWLVRSLEMQHVPSGELPTADAIVVLGGCTRPASAPRPWVDLSEEGDRVLQGIRLYQQGKAPKIIFSGGRIDWHGGGTPESQDMATIATAFGVPTAAILQDPTSLNTRQNAVNVQQILKREGMRRVLLVTSAMHMPRSLRIFQKLGIEAIPAPTDFLYTEEEQGWLSSTSEAISLNVLPDADRLRVITRALKEYVGTFVYWLRGWV